MIGTSVLYFYFVFFASLVAGNFLLFVKSQPVVVLLLCCITMAFFVLNLVTIAQFTRMGLEYIRMLSPFRLRDSVLRSLVLLTAIWTTVTLSRFMLIQEVVYIANWQAAKIGDFGYFYSLGIQNMYRCLFYLESLQPFFLAYFHLSIIGYFSAGGDPETNNKDNPNGGDGQNAASESD